MKKAFQNMFTLALSALMIINMIPGNIYAEEIEEDMNEAVQENIETPEQTNEDLPAEILVEESQQETEAPASEIKEEVKIEENKEEAPLSEEKEEKKEELILVEEAVVMMSEPMEAMNSVIEAVEEAPAKAEKIKITVNFTDIINTNGSIKTGSASSTLSKNMSSWRILQAKFNNQIPKADFSVGGTKYHFTGEWAYEDGSLVSIPMEFKYDDFNEDTIINVHPIYETIEAARLNFYKIDNISYGSGSWANTNGSFTTYSNTLKAPSAKAHYQFLYWQDGETGQIYNAGDKFSISAAEIGDGNTKDVRLYATWQPSITLRYHNINGSTISTKEVYEDISAYGYNAPAISGCKFLGWSLTPNGEVLAENTVYSKPALTVDPVTQNIIDLYPVYSVSYRVEHYIEGLDGNYSLKEAEDIADAAYNSQVTAEPRSYEGFSLSNDSNRSGIAKSGLVLKLYYSRNSYKVSYEYENVPANAPALPKTRTYRYEEAVAIEKVPAMSGYTFSGWDKENFQMPAADVVIKGSFDINSHTVSYEYENAPENAPALPENKEYEFGAEVKVALVEKIEGYTFQGWDKEDFTMPDEDVVIKGSYKINSHDVIYKVDGMNIEVPETMSYEYGKEVKVAENLELEGYTFSGWDKKDFTMPDEDVIINGSFTINSYTVSYEYENAPENAPALPENKEYEFGTEVKVAEAQKIEGYTFQGWDKEDFTMPAANVVIKGSYDINSHEVSYKVDGMDIEVPETMSYEYGKEVKIAEDLELEGYTFSGWDKEDFTMPDEDVTINGSFSINSYTVSYEYENAPENAPTLPETREYEFNSEVEVAAEEKLEGYTFSGWDKENFTMPAANVIIKGSYTVNSHNVSYKVDGMDVEVPETMSYEYGKEVKIAEDLEVEGYTFSGWDKKDFQMPDEDVTINGSFSINSYKVTYEYENAPENAPALPETKEYEFASDVKVESGLELEGYTFSGWDKEDFQMPSEDVTIKGSFTINTYSVRFLDDDGSLLELDEEVEYGNMASYDGKTPVKASDGRYSYTFTGWSKELSEVKEDQEYVAQYKAELIPIVSEDSPEESKPQSPSSPIKVETPEEPEVEIEEALAPLAEAEVEVNEAAQIIIEDDAAPKAEYKTWALYNLIATIITALTGLYMIISFFTKRNEKEEEEEENKEEEDNRRNNWSKFLGLVPMIASIIAFILTEDMRNVMVLKDRYTITMIVIALFELVLAFITRNRKEEKEEEEEDELLLIEA